jgi:hypothetical protein
MAGDYNVMPTDLDVYAPERWRDDALFRPEVRKAYAEFVQLGWKDALRDLYPGKPFWKYFRNAFARNAGLRLDHLLLSPSLKNRLIAGGIAREVRSWEKPAITRRLGSNWRISPQSGSEESAGLMARKLKTYQTSLGFFDLAIAAPSMKAALQAWGSKTNLFQQGFAKETNDPAIIAATFAKPGVVLRRPVGSDGTFSEHAELPKELPIGAKQIAQRLAATVPDRYTLFSDPGKRAGRIFVDYLRTAAA